MSMIEPNVAALAWFALFAGVASVGFYVLTGMFPLETRPDLKGRPLGLLLLAANVVLLLALVGGGLAYGAATLRWTSLVIVGGLAVLFAPGLFNVWPQPWRDGMAGLAIMLAGLGGALGCYSRSAPSSRCKQDHRSGRNPMPFPIKFGLSVAVALAALAGWFYMGYLGQVGPRWAWPSSAPSWSSASGSSPR